MNSVFKTITLIATPAAALLLVSCQDSGSGSSSALDEEIISLERKLDRLERASAAAQRTLDRAAKRTSIAERERQERYDNDRGLRSQVELVQSRVDTLKKEFATYRENCQIGTLNFDGS